MHLNVKLAYLIKTSKPIYLIHKDQLHAFINLIYYAQLIGAFF